MCVRWTNAFLGNCRATSAVIKSIPGDIFRGKDLMKYCTSPGENGFEAR